MVFTDLRLIYLAAFVSIAKIGNWMIEIENNNLLGVRINGTLPDELNLSNFNLSAINETAFANLSSLKTISLAHNRLKQLPVLTDLPNLESLNLANNNIQSGKFYIGLRSLKSLNISNNPLESFEPGHFFGLTKSANIWTRGLNISFITAAMFENPVTATSRQFIAAENKEYGIDEDDDPKLSNQTNWNKIKVCINNGHLKSVENVENSTSLPEGCREINSTSGTLFLDGIGIRTFENGWYRLGDQNVASVVLSDNEIVQFSKELLNDLPAGILNVHMARNKINKLEKGIIENRNNIDLLDLSDNFISEIEDGALKNLNITGLLLLDDNRLKDSKFLDSLPPTIQRVSADRNNIVEISDGDFTQFTKFKCLSLAGNNIEEIKALRLRGFSTLTKLSLRTNRLRSIAAGAFRDLKNLLSLDLTNNGISILNNRVFSGLENIRHISLESNKLEEILNDLLAKMPGSLEILSLGKNKIRIWMTGKLGNVRPFSQSWQWTPIHKLPTLKILDLHDNLLNKAEGKFFKGLENLACLSLAGNQIRSIEKGFAKHLRNLNILDLSQNPITKLTNGALFGLPKDSTTVIRTSRVPLELIQGGLFDDV